MKHLTEKHGCRRLFSFLLAVLMLTTFIIPASAMQDFDDLSTITDLTGEAPDNQPDTGGEPDTDPSAPVPDGNDSETVPEPEEGEAITGNENDPATPTSLGVSGEEWADPPDGFTFRAYPANYNARARSDTSTVIGMTKDTSIQHRYPFKGGTSMMPAYIFYTQDGRAAYCVEPARFNSYHNNYVTGSVDFSSLSATQKTQVAKAVAANTRGYSNSAYYFATQVIIWEICSGQKHRTGSVYDACIAANSAKLSGPYEEILGKMDSVSEIPSFMSADESNPTLHTMAENGGSWSIDLTNSNSNVTMSASDFRSKAQLNFNVSENTLTVTSDAEPDADSFVEWHSGSGDSGLVFWNSDVQKKVSQSETGTVPSSGYMVFHAEASPPPPPDEEEEPKIGYLTIYKYNGMDNQPLGGAIFRVESEDFVDEGFVVPYGGGTIVIPIPEGKDSIDVTVTEITPPQGFVGDPTPKTVTVTASEQVNIAQVGFANYPEACSLTIYKYEKGNYGKPLEGAKFRIRYADPNVSAQVWTLTTDSAGEIHIDLPAAGTLIVEELEAPQGGYVMGEITSWDVTVIRGEDKRIDISNDKKAELIVYKKDAVTHEYLSGAVFKATLLESHTPPYESGITYTATTGADGKAVFTGLHPGQWRVEEQTPPQFYLPSSRVETVTVLDGSQEAVVLTWENDPYSGLTIKKVCAETGNPLKGAIFSLYKGTEVHPTDFLGDYQSNENGMVIIQKLESNQYYTVVERQAPENYLIDPDHSVQTVLIKPDAVEQNITIIFRNPPKPKLLIEKTDETGRKLPNAMFRVSRRNSAEYLEVTTGPDGTVLLEGLADDWYTVREIRSPEGVILNEQEYDVQLLPGKTVTLSIVNVRKPSFTLRKIDEITGRGIDGVVFRITREGVDEHVDVTTQGGGYLRLDNQEPGFILVQELRAGANYVLDDTIHRIELKPGENHEMVFTNRQKPKLTIRKVDEQTREGIEGVCFRLTQNGEYMDVWTGPNGVVTVQIAPGWWTVEERSVPSNYILNPEPQYVQLVAGEDKEILITNRHKPSLKIIKLDSVTLQPMEGVRFAVKYKNGAPLGEFKTNADGEIFLEDIDPGLLEIEELPFDGYTPLEPYKEILVEYGKVAVVEFRNEPLNPIIIKKIDEHGIPVPDTVFRVNKINGEFVGEYRTGRNGFATVTGVEPGFYQVLETQSAPGFILDSTVHVVELKYNNTAIVEVVNKKLNGIRIYKTDELGNPLDGVTFVVKEKSGNLIGEYVTQNGGIIDVPDLSPNWYTVYEKATLPDYLLDPMPRDVELKWGDYAALNFVNTKLSAFQARKIDSVTKLPISGIHFRVTRLNGEIIGEYVTNSAGIIAAELEPGAYVCFETRTIPGYVLDTTPQTFEVKKGKNILLEFENKPLCGLQIRKTDTVTGLPLSGVEFRLTELDGRIIGTYKTDSTGTVFVSNLAEGYFQLAEITGIPNYKPDPAPRNIYVKTGELNIVEWKNTPYPFLDIRKVDKETKQPIEGVRIRVMDRYSREIGVFTTNAQGRILLSVMDEGKYFCQEVEAKPGYLLDSTVREVSLKYGETTVLEVANVKMASFRLLKICAETGKPIPGVRFLLKDMKNNIIGEYETDSTGLIELPEQLAGGKYKLQEIKAASNFVLDDTIHIIELKAGETFELTLKNQPERGKIRIIKKSSDANVITGDKKGAVLEGATFEIVDEDRNVVDTITTDERGIAVSKPLPLARFAIREIESPDYYLLSNVVFYADLKKHDDTVEFEVENEPADISVTVEKRGNVETLSGGPNRSGDTIRYDFSNIANTSNCELEEFYWHDQLPVDAVRLQKIFTGTWNERLTYRVEYRTNLKTTYRTWESGLHTNTNHELDVSALKLAGNEYITDFRFVFGTVKADFHEEEAPFIFVKVLDNLPNEYRFTNKTDVGGRRGKEWAYAKDAWTTIVYKADLKKGNLPKTGL